jgi:menaquinone-specific isochorismate synthase
MHLELSHAYLKIDSPSRQDLIRGAIAKAQNLDRSVILTYSYVWENVDPLLFLSHKCQPGQPRFYWQQPHQNLAIAAGGMVVALPQLAVKLPVETEITAPPNDRPNNRQVEDSADLGDPSELELQAEQDQQIELGIAAFGDRFSLAREWVRQLLSCAVVGGQANCPHLKPHIIGGFSFYDRPRRQIWQDFPAVRLFLPRWIMRKQANICTVAINTCIQPHDHSDQIETALFAIHDALRQDFDDLGVLPGKSDTNVKQPIRLVNHATTPQTLRSLRPPAIPPQQSDPANRADLSNLNKLSNHAARDLTDQALAQGKFTINEVNGDRPWTDAVKQAVGEIKAGKFDKVVLARALDITASDRFDPHQVIDSLRQSYPECINFALNFGGQATFLGATPELLLEFKHEQAALALKSDAVAGSTGRGNSDHQDQQMGDRLLHSNKDLNEHRIVVKSICDRLQQMGATIETINPPQLLKLANVQHLHTPIVANLKVDDWLVAFDILGQLHPTAAVGGEPRQVAIDVMQSLEKCDRGWYAAPIGWVNGDGEGAFAVGIRSGYLDGNQARLYAGAGIVADSKFDAELGETKIKFEALCKALGIDQ